MAHSFTFPRHAAELEPRLQDNTWCTAYVFLLRWPDGFICPGCGAHHPIAEPLKNPVCRRCGKHCSVTAGTLLHGSKKQLCSWLQTIWWLTDRKNPPTIKTIQRRLSLQSYQTAWTWMSKLRLAMQLAIREKCKGTVSIDCAPGSPDRYQGNELPILAAVESIAGGRSVGRIRLACCDNLTPAEIVFFLHNCILAGSTIIAPDKDPFQSVKTLDYIYTVDNNRSFHTSVQQIFNLYYAWYSKRNYHTSDPAALQRCLDEFGFQQNSSLYTDRLDSFVHLLSAMLEHEPAPVRNLRTAGRTEGGLP